MSPAGTSGDRAPDYELLQAILISASQPIEPEPAVTTTTVAPPVTVPTTAPVVSVAPVTRAPAKPADAEGNNGDFALPPGAKLPTGAECAKRVKKTKEYKPENKKANGTKGKKLNLAPNWGSNAGAYMSRVDGNFTGTTDEIVQWAACKWGLETDAVRAQVMVESSWRQGATAAPTSDVSLCPAGTKAPEDPEATACMRAFGLLQIRSDFHPGTYPMIAQSTAYNVDYGLGMKRACYDGKLWVGPQSRGDAWGCVGVHYSGKWMDDAAKGYIAAVKAQYQAKPWTRFR